MIKRFTILTLLVGVALGGCAQKQGSAGSRDSDSDSGGNVPIVNPEAASSVSTGTQSTPNKNPHNALSSQATPNPSTSRNLGSPNVMPPKSRPGTNLSAPPKPENFNAGPPKPGEQVANDFRIQAGPQTVEVEGVCKLTEDEAICWKPNGETNKDLANELTNAIKSKTDGYSNTFQFKFMKKNRILVLKTTTAPIKPGQNFNGSYNSSVMMENNYGGPNFVEGWTSNNSIFSGASSTGFDQSRVERQVLTGAFNKETKTFPLRYQSSTYSPNHDSVSFRKGELSLDGNIYEITSISDKATNPGYQPYVQPGQKAPKMTFVTVKIIKITNPNSVANLTPADDSGQPYGGLDDKGNPITQAEVQKQREEESRKMMEASRAGKPFVGRINSMNRYVTGFPLDPLHMNSGGQSLLYVQFNVESSKVKKLAINITHRTVYVFDKVRLDKN